MATLREPRCSRWETELSSTHRTGLEWAVCGTHYPNIKQWREGVKKEQVKG